jgi:membrane-associated phospholipid phosphatase
VPPGRLKRSKRLSKQLHNEVTGQSATRSDRRTRRWWRAGATVLILAALFALFYRYDPLLLAWQKRLRPVVPESVWGQLLSGFKAFGELLTIGTVVVLVALYDRRRRAVLVALLLAELLANGIYERIKVSMRRERPRSVLTHVEDPAMLRPADTWLPAGPDVTGQESRSFPSGHSASAFALAGVLGWYYGRATLLFWTLALGCVASRYLVGAHWPTDCAAGALLGYLCALVGVAMGDRLPLPHAAGHSASPAPP